MLAKDRANLWNAVMLLANYFLLIAFIVLIFNNIKAGDFILENIASIAFEVAGLALSFKGIAQSNSYDEVGALAYLKFAAFYCTACMLWGLVWFFLAIIYVINHKKDDRDDGPDFSGFVVIGVVMLMAIESIVTGLYVSGAYFAYKVKQLIGGIKSGEQVSPWAI